jgi:hypothetical protein
VLALSRAMQPNGIGGHEIRRRRPGHRPRAPDITAECSISACRLRPAIGTSLCAPTFAQQNPCHGSFMNSVGDCLLFSIAVGCFQLVPVAVCRSGAPPVVLALFLTALCGSIRFVSEHCATLRSPEPL